MIGAPVRHSFQVKSQGQLHSARHRHRDGIAANFEEPDRLQRRVTDVTRNPGASRESARVPSSNHMLRPPHPTPSRIPSDGRRAGASW